MLTWQAQNYFISGEVPRAGGARHPMIAPSEVFKCADGEWLAVSPTGEGFWRDFCRVLGNTELVADPRFSTPAARIANVDALAGVLGKAFAARPAKQWEEEFFAARVPAGKVYDVAEAVNQPLARLRGMVDELPHPQTGHLMRMLGSAFKFTDSPVLKALCGYSEAKLQDLKASKAIAGCS